MTSEPKAPGAPAIILSYTEADDAESAEVTVHVRIKVLTEGGLDAANVHIPAGIVENDGFSQSTAKPQLSPSTRTAPLSFPEAYAQRDQMQIHLAPGLAVETLPETRTLSVQTDAAYNTSAHSSPKDPHLLVSERVFILKRIDWKPEEYTSLHTYFAQLASHDQDQIVLRLNPAQAQTP